MDSSDVFTPLLGSSSEPASYAHLFRPVKNGTLNAEICCLISVSLATGMLPLPFLFRSNGVFVAGAMFVGCAFLTYGTLKYLISTAKRKNIYDYAVLVAEIYGQKHPMVLLCVVAMLINSFGSIIVWNIYIREFIDGLLHYFLPEYASSFSSSFCTFALLFFVQIPIVVFKKGEEFDIMSFVGVLQIFYVMIVVLIELPMYFKIFFSPSIFFTTKFYFKFNYKILELPFIFFAAFGNHSTILSAVSRVNNKTEERVQFVGKRAFYMEIFIYAFFMVVCFFSTFERTEENFLKRPFRTRIMMLAQVNMIILMVCNISLYFFTTLPTFEYLFNSKKKFTDSKINAISFLLLPLLTSVSLFVDHSYEILAVLGVFSQYSLIFVLPCFFYIREEKPDENKQLLIFIFLGVLGVFGVAGVGYMIYRRFIEEYNKYI